MVPAPDHILTILAVRSLEDAARFYDAAFGWPRRVDVEVYIEYELPDGRGLGIMRREAFAANSGRAPVSVAAEDVLGNELYFHTADLEAASARISGAGATALSPRKPRGWGDEAAYFADPDGNVVVVAGPLERPGIEIRSIDQSDRDWIRRETERLFGGSAVISRGVAHEPAALPGFVAWLGGDRAGVATYRLDAGEAELVTIDALERRLGVGTALLEAVEQACREAGIGRLWLITTNDNLDAVRFYQRRGYRLAGIHREALAESRKLKPSIPLVGNFGIPIRDELLLAKNLADLPSTASSVPERS
jgi:GNAT superfamily N-acetyltransferase